MNFLLRLGFRWATLVLLAAGLGLSGGCASSKPKSAEEQSKTGKQALSAENRELARGCLSAVEIRGHSLVTVQETTESVFTGSGLAVVQRNQDAIVFERPATRKEKGAYGTWFGEDVRVRLRVEFQNQSGGVFFLRCRSFIARDAGTHAEDQQALARRHVRNYEGLLDEVSSRLN